MVQLSKDIIGTKLSNFEYEIGREKIKEFLLAIGEENPIYHDQEEAKKVGYSDTPAPLTFITSINFWGNPQWLDDFDKLGIDVKKLLHLKESYDYVKPIYPNMKVNYSSQVADVKIGKMNMVTLVAILKDEKDDTLLKQESTIIIRPE